MPRDVDEAFERLAEAEPVAESTDEGTGEYRQDSNHGPNDQAHRHVARSERERGLDIETPAIRDSQSSTHGETSCVASADPTDWPVPHAVAQCRRCRGWLTDDQLETHHEECPERSVGSCRFCSEEFRTDDEMRDHWYDCLAFHRWFHTDGHTVEEDRGPRDSNLDAVSFQPVVNVQPHEFSAYLKYDTSGLSSPFRWYEGLMALAQSESIDAETEMTYTVDELPRDTRERIHARSDGSSDSDPCERWTVRVEWKDSGLAVPDREALDDWIWPHDTVGEPMVRLFPAEYASYDAADDDGAKRVTFQLSPRWPGQEAKGSGSSTNPIDLIGVNVEVSGSYFEFCRYPTLLEDAVDALESLRRSDTPSTVPIDARAFDKSRIHRSSNVVDAELYVRVRSEHTGEVYAFDGTLHRISSLLSSTRDGYAASVRDDTGCPGYHHTATIGDKRAAELVDGHNFAKEFKHYHVENPEAVDEEPLTEPKVCASFQHSKSDETVYWRELDAFERELEESLLGLLRWSDIPLRPDGNTFVADDHFVPTWRSKFRRIVSDPTPEIRAEQERRTELVAVASGMTEIDTELLRTLLEDGREFTQSDLADEIGCCVSSVRRSLDRLDGLVVHDYGDVRLRSQYVAEQLIELLPAAEESLARPTGELVEDLLESESIGAEDDSIWERFKTSFVESVDRASDGKDEIRFGTDCSSVDEFRRLVRQGALAWQASSGAEFAREFARHFDVRGRVDGRRVESLSMGALRDALPAGAARSEVT